MRDSLMKHGVDSARIVLDYDGTRTLNSIAKIRSVYCQDSITIISQNSIMNELYIKRNILELMPLLLTLRLRSDALHGGVIVNEIFWLA